MDYTQKPIRCEYALGYDVNISIMVVSILPCIHVKEQYLELITEDGKSYPATWLDWDHGGMKAGCYENF